MKGETGMIIETERLILRPWSEDDAEDLYCYASDPDVGPAAGWSAHASVEESREIIRTILSAPETYAVVPKSLGHAAGSVGLMLGDASGIDIPDTEAEIGYWIAKPLWGQGLMPEAVRALMRYAFVDLGLDKLWCGYYVGNDKSRRVQEKCGFVYHHTVENQPCRIEGVFHTEIVSCITCEEWDAAQIGE